MNIKYKHESVHYNDALNKIIEYIPLMDSEEKSVSECSGQLTSENIYADINIPISDLSIPDGYAVISEDTKNASMDNPVRLKVIDSARAGHICNTILEKGCAVRIMTGAVIPEGADSVVWFEDTDEILFNTSESEEDINKEVSIFKCAAPGDNIRIAGSDVRKGDLLLASETIIGPTQISVLLSAGKTTIKVLRRPLVALIATGDEIIGTGESLKPGMRYNSNTEALSALVRFYGGIPEFAGIAGDNEESLLSNFNKCMDADIIVTSGGVSRGDYDLVKYAIEKLGHVEFSRIYSGHASAMFSKIRRDHSKGNKYIPVFSLPGTPAGCLISFIILVRHAILKARGLKDAGLPVIEAVAEDSISSRTAEGFFKWTSLRKKNGIYTVTLNFNDNPMDFTSIAKANSITMIPGFAKIKPGDKINVMPLEWCK
ncbi:MAG: molybdopterin molybdotransferase MoeA [Spirochaetes bacterium]|nr:molybdopterin molybdotransferase MoeA [Spirochaetota bacterium]